MKKYRIPKLIGLVILTMITLVLASFLEVAIYSYLINPGHPAAFYEEHANLSAPYISAVFGFIIFFLIVRHWTKKGYEDAAKLAMLFPLTYIIIDLFIVTIAAGDTWADFVLIFLISNGAKILGAFAGYKFAAPKIAKSQTSF